MTEFFGILAIFALCFMLAIVITESVLKVVLWIFTPKVAREADALPVYKGRRG